MTLLTMRDKRKGSEREKATKRMSKSKEEGRTGRKSQSVFCQHFRCWLNKGRSQMFTPVACSLKSRYFEVVSGNLEQQLQVDTIARALTFPKHNNDFQNKQNWSTPVLHFSKKKRTFCFNIPIQSLQIKSFLKNRIFEFWIYSSRSWWYFASYLLLPGFSE